MLKRQHPWRNQWLEKNIIRLPNITRMRQNPIAPLPSNTAKAIMPRARNIPQTPSNILKWPANIASRPIPKVNSRSELTRPDESRASFSHQSRGLVIRRRLLRHSGSVWKQWKSASAAILMLHSHRLCSGARRYSGSPSPSRRIGFPLPRPSPPPHVRRSKLRRHLAAMGQSLHFRDVRVMSVLPLPAQPVDATQALNLSAGVSNCKVSRGRSFS